MANESQLAKLTEMIEASTKWPGEQWEKLSKQQKRWLVDHAIDKAVVEAAKLVEKGVQLSVPAMPRIEPPEPLQQLIEYAVKQVVREIVEYVEFSEIGELPPRLQAGLSLYHASGSVDGKVAEKRSNDSSSLPNSP